MARREDPTPRRRQGGSPARSNSEPRSGQPRSGQPRGGAKRAGAPRTSSSASGRGRSDGTGGAPRSTGSSRAGGGRTGGSPRSAATVWTGGARTSGGARTGGRASTTRTSTTRTGNPRNAASGARSGRSDRTPRPPRPPRAEDKAPKTWGSLARKSLRNLKDEDGDQVGGARQAWRDAVAKARGDQGRDVRDEPWEPERWVEERETPRPQTRPVSRATQSRARAGTARDDGRAARAVAAAGPTRPRRKLPKDVSAEVVSHTHGGGPGKIERYQERLADAAKAYERDRYRDALKLLKPLAEALPGASAVRELYGLTLYRLGRWDGAIRELEAFRALERDDYDQHPTLADCYRAKKRWKQVDELWEELRQASPSAELVAEGRIVAAGALADQGQVRAAIELLEHGPATPKRPKLHHIRLWYALADLYERAGELPRARELFRHVADADPDYANAAERLAGLG